LGLHLSNGRQLTYASDNGRLDFFDPSVSEPGPHAALVDRTAFLSMLEREELAAFWVIAGEKSIYSGRDSGMGWGGDSSHTYIYELIEDSFVSYKHLETREPSADQLETFLRRRPGSGDQHVACCWARRSRDEATLKPPWAGLRRVE
jgi:hypothetical protein